MEIGQIIQLAGMLLGGVGLFLLAVRMITDGLTMAAGEALRDILSVWTQTLARGVVAGLGFTAIVQSSSAVTVATIGFVNAGLLSLSQALGVVYGANIGTTMTGWLVAAVGFKINVDAFALPMIGLGMLLRLTGATQRWGAIGEALAGFGLFFIGIEVLKNAFEGMAQGIDFQSLAPEGIMGMLLYVWLGFLMTMLMQSSSAAIAIVLTAATGGVLPLASAASMVVGANVGTTSTAALVVIGATPNAKRVASVHIIFNIITGIVAVMILPGMLWLVQEAGRTLRMEEHPAVILALFHTTFNILGLILLWPITRALARFMERRFVSLEERIGRPQYLDKTVSASPVLALHALALELGRLSSIAREVAHDAMNWERTDSKKIVNGEMAVEKLTLAVGEFVSRMERGSLPQAVSELLPKILRTSQYFNSVVVLARTFAKESTVINRVTDGPVKRQLEAYREAVLDLVVAMEPQSSDYDDGICDHKLDEMEAAYEQVKREILEAGAMARIRIAGMSALLEEISRLRRLGEQTVKGTKDLAGVLNSTILSRTTEGQGEQPHKASIIKPQQDNIAENLTPENREEISKPVGHDFNCNGSENQTEQAIKNVQTDWAEDSSNGASKA